MKFEYNGQQIELPDNVRKYVKAVQRKLKLPKKIRDNVLSDLITGMCSRNENGESYEKIMETMGTPAQIAAGLNEEMSDFAFHKSPWRWGCLAVSILSAGVIFMKGLGSFSLFFANRIINSVGVIGGADGPTAVFVTTSPGIESVSIVVAAILLVMSLIGFYALGHLKHK